MSWFSRSGGSWAGRFSPFGRPGASPSAGEVSDSDFSYITSEDLKKASASGSGASDGRNRASSRAAEIVDWDDKDPDRDTDVLIFKNGRTHYPTHFPAQSIRDGHLKISTVRQAAAKKIGVDDPRRIRLFFKGKNLKHDERTAREEGLRGDGTGSEILCAVGDAPSGGMAPGTEDMAPRTYSDGEDDDDDDEDDASGLDSGANSGTKKKSRRRGKKNKKKNRDAHGNAGPGPPGYSNASAAGPEYLPIPSHLGSGQRPASAASSSSNAAAPRGAPSSPQTPLGKLEAIASKLHTEFVPLCVQFMQSPPEDKTKRQFEYKKLSETILTQILMKLDGVETEGDQEARMKRRELVKETQGMLSKLDESVK